MIQSATLTCPYCGEPILLSIDCSVGDQQYIEDCHVCCQPMLVSAKIDPEGRLLDVQLEQENP